MRLGRPSDNFPPVARNVYASLLKNSKLAAAERFQSYLSFFSLRFIMEPRLFLDFKTGYVADYLHPAPSL